MTKRMGPGDVPRSTPVETPSDDGGEPVVIEAWQRQDATERKMAMQLSRLREQFPQERIEKLPKPLWKGAWDGHKGNRCSVCHGYHVLENAIHLDYIGHANVTDRLLEIDPFWDWEPLAFTPDGLPKFDGFGGLWIKLTVCGVTRLGYGDATGRAGGTTAVKEIIGDAIRNAAMRFGVGLELWAKVDLHEARNVGDGETPRRENSSMDGGGRGGRAEGARRPSGDGAPVAVAADSPRAANQDALDALKSVCDNHGYSLQYAASRFVSDYDVDDIRRGSAEDIFEFADILVAEATAEPSGDGEDSGDGAGEGVGQGDERGDLADGESSDEAQAELVQPGVPETASGDVAAGADEVDPLDTSDVEKKPGEMF